MRGILAFVCLCATLLPSEVTGQTLRRSLGELSRESDAVVVGKTLSTESYWTADRSAIMTRVKIRIDESVAGALSGEATILVPGGQVGEYLHEVSDMPIFAADEEVMVFVTRLSTGEFIVAGGMQGKLDVIRDPSSGDRTVLAGAGLVSGLDVDLVEGSTSFPAAAGDQMIEADDEKTAVPLVDFVKRVKRLEQER